jgi:hypothetical protein
MNLSKPWDLGILSTPTALRSLCDRHAHLRWKEIGQSPLLLRRYIQLCRLMRWARWASLDVFMRPPLKSSDALPNTLRASGVLCDALLLRSLVRMHCVMHCGCDVWSGCTA